MKIGPIRIKWHEHKWEKTILHEDDSVNLSIARGEYLLKVGEKCVAPECDAGGYRSVYFIYCKNKPNAYKID